MNVNDPARAKEELDRGLASGDHEAVARAAMSNIWPLLNSHTEQLVRAVAMLDTRVLERYPVLRIVHPMTEVLARSARPFKPQMPSEDARSMGPEEIDFLIVVQMIAFCVSGDVPAAVRYARRLEDRVQQTRVESRDRLDGPLWFYHYQIGSTFLAAGDSSRALSEFTTARQLGRLSAQTDAERIVLGRMALALAVRGSLGDADRALQEAHALPAPGPAHAKFSVSSEITAAALISAERLTGDLDGLLGGLDPYDAVELTWPFGLLARVRGLLAEGRWAEALEVIRMAEDGYPVHPGSIAFDVVSATLIDALLTRGDLSHAGRIAAERSDAGVLTMLAIVRLSLHTGDWRKAAVGLRMLGGDNSLGPAQRAESVILSGWLELARTGDLGRESAVQLLRIAQRPDNRRLMTLMPTQLVQQVGQRLSDDMVVQFNALTDGLSRVEMRTRPDLTDGEHRVLNALVSGKSTVAIAAAFHVSPNTVKSQLRTLYRKLDCSTRDEAISEGARWHLLSVDART